jgi:hypothetical protein
MRVRVRASLHGDQPVVASPAHNPQPASPGGRVVGGKDVEWLGDRVLLAIGLLLMGLAVWMSLT